MKNYSYDNFNIVDVQILQKSLQPISIGLYLIPDDACIDSVNKAL